MDHERLLGNPTDPALAQRPARHAADALGGSSSEGPDYFMPSTSESAASTASTGSLLKRAAGAGGPSGDGDLAPAASPASGAAAPFHLSLHPTLHSRNTSSPWTSKSADGGDQDGRLSPIVIESPTTPKGTIMASIINLANTILGAGLLAMPAALGHVGWLAGVILIAFSGFISAFGLRLLTDCAAVVGRRSSFASLAAMTFPSAGIFFDTAITIKCLGVSVSYLVIVGELIPQIVLGVKPDLAETPESLLLSRAFWITIALAAVAPLTFLRSLSALRFTSYVALSAATYLLLLVVYFGLFYSGAVGETPGPDELPIVLVSTSWFTTVPIFVFAFTCHQNIFAIYNELIGNTPARIKRVIYTAIGVSGGFYETVGVIGFFTFGTHVKSNIIAMYPASSAILVGQVAIVLLVILSYPLQCHPCRISLNQIVVHFGRRMRGSSANGLSNVFPSGDKPVTPLQPGASLQQTPAGSEADLLAPAPRVEPATTRIPTRRFALMTVGIIIVTYAAAVLVRDLSVVLALVGATGSTTICYILPGLFYYKMYQKGLVGHGSGGSLPVAAGPSRERRMSVALSNDQFAGDGVTVAVDSVVYPAVSRPRHIYIGSMCLAAWGILVMLVSLATQVISLFQGRG